MFRSITSCNRWDYVCGDKAIGRNFFAITCESCKAFFRRYALKNKPFECPSNGKCMLTPKTRQLCKKCRLEKCFTMGMKKELIRSCEENQLRYLQVIENKRKQQMIQNTDSVDSSHSTNSCVSMTTQTDVVNDFITELIESTLNISDAELNEQIMDIEMTINTSKNVQIYDEICHKYAQMSVSPIFRVIPDYEGWKELEYNRISELLCASNTPNISYVHVMKDLLVKVWPELESDPVIRNLFTAIILFNPKRPNLTHRHNVQ
ncbi:unnamed protein product [Oppiella nova]|uniref:Nuclear receptor domain-containing protein n=1 Tax=Oppiella nova TaxID=334625 RepID=A0A7R9LEF7_9ACAR|nr:unnamed protein product [Oppiella nova]CAG2162123.1 unnamed protein product [Oppiella nova]